MEYKFNSALEYHANTANIMLFKINTANFTANIMLLLYYLTGLK